MNLKKYFINLPLFQKIEIYLIVVMLYGALYYLMDDNYLFQNNQEELISKNLQDNKHRKILKSKIIKKENNFLVKLIEQKSGDFECFIEEIKIKTNSIDINISGKYISVIEFLNFLQNHFLINSFNINFDKNIFIVVVSLDTKYFYNPNKIYNNIVNIPNPFIKINKHINKITKKSNPIINIKIDAIVDSNVFIKDNWYKLNDIYNNKKIVSIGLNSVEFIDMKTLKKEIKRVHNED